MTFTKADLVQCQNLVAALKKGRYELDGMEVLAYAQMFAWVSNLQEKIAGDIIMNTEAAAALASAKEVKDPIEPGPTKKRGKHA